MLLGPPKSTRFPCTTLFRSLPLVRAAGRLHRGGADRARRRGASAADGDRGDRLRRGLSRLAPRPVAGPAGGGGPSHRGGEAESKRSNSHSAHYPVAVLCFKK